MEIEIINKTEEVYKRLKQETGASKVWVANQMNITPQRLNDIFKASNLTLEVLIKLSIILKCDISDLYEYKIIKL